MVDSRKGGKRFGMLVTTEKSKRTIGDILLKKAEQYGDTPFVFYHEDIVSYRQMNQRATRVSGYFQSIGIGKGDKVIIYLENCLEWLYAWYGLAKLGAVSVLLNTAHKGQILEYQINNSDAGVMITSRQLMGQISPIQHKLNGPKKIIVCPDDEGIPDATLATVSFSELLKAPPLKKRDDTE